LTDRSAPFCIATANAVYRLEPIGVAAGPSAFSLLAQSINDKPRTYDRADDRRGPIGDCFLRSLDPLGCLAERFVVIVARRKPED
jgi:hypothetical protein